MNILTMIVLAASCASPSSPGPVTTTGAAVPESAGTGSPLSSHGPSETSEAGGGTGLAHLLNQDLVSFIEQAGLTPLGGGDDWMSASNSVQAENSTVISVFIYPIERANLGDVSFEETETTEVDGTRVVLGSRSDEQAGARFNCGDFQFKFHGDSPSAVKEVATGIASEVPCPYDPST